MINDLNIALSEGKSKATVETILNKLIEYTGYHFGKEEDQFKKFNYPDAAAHIELHKAFVQKVFEFQSLNEDVGHFKTWWKNRILRVVLVMFFTTIGSAIGTYVGGYEIIKNIF